MSLTQQRLVLVCFPSVAYGSAGSPTGGSWDILLLPVPADDFASLKRSFSKRFCGFNKSSNTPVPFGVLGLSSWSRVVAFLRRESVPHEKGLLQSVSALVLMVILR